MPPSAVATPEIPARPRAVAIAITWLAYASFYLGRKGLSVVKTSITGELGKTSLYGVETSLLAAYALGQYVNGFLGDRVGPKRLLAAGLVVSAIACVAFGLSTAWPLFIVAFLVNGFAQSAGWPGCAKAMAEWTTPADRGRVMGVWGTSYQVGPILATALATRLMIGFGWRSAFIGPAALLVLVAVVVAVGLRRGPNSARGGEDTPEPSPEAKRVLEAERSAEQKRLLKTPLIYLYGASYFFIKLIRYSIFFWLPTYLENVLHYDKAMANYLSTSFDVGGLIGTVGLGFASDRLSRLPRPTIAVGSLFMLAAALAIYQHFGGISQTMNFVLMGVVGLLLYGPDSIVSGAAAQDAGGKHAASLAAGMVNGIGSIGAIFQETIIRVVSERYGWQAVFQLFVWAAIASGICLVPTVLPKRSLARVT